MLRHNFKSARLDCDLTQRELAEVVGVTENYIRQVENGRRDPRGKVMLHISRALRRPSEELFEDLLDE
ncbi:helix-turn-helix transcriptional regulator [Paenibacillus apiarius]|uniref:helix-turn-helix transcriptional regulator n=1 Tax=Paenibacillus apiarius TaxID=46240 RepID=UPI003B3A47E7